MFDIGFWELTLIMVIVLIVVGPERLPSMARTAGLWISKIRRMVGDVKAEVERELRSEELRGNLQKGTLDELKRVAGDVRTIGRDLHRDVAESEKKSKPTPGLGKSEPPTASAQRGASQDPSPTSSSGAEPEAQQPAPRAEGESR